MSASAETTQPTFTVWTFDPSDEVETIRRADRSALRASPGNSPDPSRALTVAPPPALAPAADVENTPDETAEVGPPLATAVVLPAERSPAERDAASGRRAADRFAKHRTRDEAYRSVRDEPPPAAPTVKLVV